MDWRRGALEESLKLALPLVFASVYLTACYTQRNGLFTFSLVYFLTPLGRFAVYPFAVVGSRERITVLGRAIDVSETFLTPWDMVLAMSVVDGLCALFIIWNFDYAKRVPLIGGFMRTAESRSREILERHRWVKGLTYTGIFLLTLSPFYGTNAIVGSIVAKICGLEPAMSFACILLGSFVGALLMSIPGVLVL